GESQEDAGSSTRGQLVRRQVADKRPRSPDPERRHIANLPRPQQGWGGLRTGDSGVEVDLMRRVPDRKRPQKMGGIRMHHR
ncbi:unnamed protein product, partial [Closterium sp. NIES-53]